MKYQRLNLDLDYETINFMFKDNWDGEGVPKDKLPTDGVVAIDEELGVVGACFIYLISNSYMCILGFPVLSVQLSENRKETLLKMFEYLEFLAMYNGYRYMNTWSGTPQIEKLLSGSGYDTGDADVTHYSKNLI